MFKKKEKLTQEELASKLHVSPQVISKWENGRNFPKDPDILINISNILDVSLEELLYGEYKTKENKDIITNNFNKEYKNNYNKYKKVLIISIITILILIICFLIFIYLNNIKNKIKQYKITSDGEFNISGNILVTNTLTTLFMNKIEDNNISYITLYYKKDNNEYLICSGSNMTINIIDYNDYKDTYFVFYTDKDIDNIIYNENNIIDIHKDNIDDDTYKYSYEFKLKHYYDFMNNIKYFKEKLYNNNVKFDEEINVNGVSSLDIGDTINIINIIVTCIIIVDIIVLVITLFNLVVDEENSNRLCKYLGYNSIQISITTIIKVLYVIIIPLVLSLLAYFILLRIY